MPRINHPKICPICREVEHFKFIRGFNKERSEYSLYQCSGCWVQFWLPLKTVGHNWYEKNSPYQIRDLVGSGIYRGYHKDFLKRYKSFPQNTKVLDLGCGTGEFISELEKRGCHVWGLDFDRGATKIAKERFGLKNVYSLSFADFFQRKDFNRSKR